MCLCTGVCGLHYDDDGGGWGFVDSSVVILIEECSCFVCI